MPIQHSYREYPACAALSETGSMCMPPQGIQLVCPVCGFEYTHLKAAYNILGNDNWEANWGGRGDLMVLEFQCEELHDFQVCFGFHKGCHSVFVRASEETVQRHLQEEREQKH